MNILTQEARKRQSVVKLAIRKGKSFACRIYSVSLSSVKRWCVRYDGTWQSLRERSHRPHSHPREHTAEEDQLIRRAYYAAYERYGHDGAYAEALKQGYRRSLSGMVHRAKQIGLLEKGSKKPPRKQERRYPELGTPGEKVQVDVKEVPFNCLRGNALRYGKHFYQYTAIDECTRFRFVYAYEEQTQENSADFLKRLEKAFPFKIKTVQTDNGHEFTYKFMNTDKLGKFDEQLKELEIAHKLIPPRTPWHNGKVERSHRNDQRYFYNWENFGSADELNNKLIQHLEWSNNKTMRTLDGKSPAQMLREKLEAEARGWPAGAAEPAGQPARTA